MSWDRIKGQWKLRRGKAMVDGGVAAITRKHEEALANRQQQIGITRHTPITGGLSNVSHGLQNTIQRLKKLLG